MNVLDLMKDLDNQKIMVKGFNVDNDKKVIELLLKMYDLQYILVAHKILSNHAKEFIANGFSIAVKYEISIEPC